MPGEELNGARAAAGAMDNAGGDRDEGRSRRRSVCGGFAGDLRMAALGGRALNAVERGGSIS
jgi:hypothetical protein